jgi:pimeloyl-ACP methyl ester carboxylesterase
MIRHVLCRAMLGAALIVVGGGCNAATGPTQSTLTPPSAAPSGSHVAIRGVITVDPPEVQIDEPVSIRLSGFPPDHEVTVRATTVGTAFPNFVDTGLVRESSATFTTDVDGEVDLASATPLRGSYAIVNAMGLFWSMRETTAGTDPPPQGAPIPFAQYRYELTAEVDGTDVASASVVQDLGSPDVTATEIAEGGVLGQFYLPPGDGPFPAVIVLAGSNGGLTWRRPKVLATHGYAVLSLPYFNYTSPLDGTSLPSTTIELPLEYFGKAIEWLQAQPSVDADRIGIYGTSLGGQVAMLVGARYPELKSVIAVSPPIIPWDGGPGHSSFSFQGKPVPFAVPFAQETMAQPFRDAVGAGRDFRATIPGILATMKADPEIAAAMIPVERINGSVLIVSGTADTQLPSVVFGELAMDRLSAHGFVFPYRHIIGEGAGHGIDVPYVDRSSEISEGGGTPESMELAGEAMWPAALADLAAMK